MSEARARLQYEGHLAIWCPACDTAHGVRVAPALNPWAWNGSLDLPTLTPSIKATWGQSRPGAVCHSHVTDGKIAFCPDSTHALSGKTVELPPWPFS